MTSILIKNIRAVDADTDIITDIFHNYSPTGSAIRNFIFLPSAVNIFSCSVI